MYTNDLKQHTPILITFFAKSEQNSVFKELFITANSIAKPFSLIDKPFS